MSGRSLGLRSRTGTTVAAAWAALLSWGSRRYVTAAVAALITVLVVAVPTAMVPNPVFGREIGVTAWAWPALVITAVLSGLLFATYVREKAPADATAAEPDAQVPAEQTREGKAGAVGGFLTFLAVGCPVCNKVALLALGYSGAIQWFAPVQPWLAVGAIGLLGWALVRRLAYQDACPIPAAGVDARASVPADPRG